MYSLLLKHINPHDIINLIQRYVGYPFLDELIETVQERNEYIEYYGHYSDSDIIIFNNKNHTAAFIATILTDEGIETYCDTC